MQSINRRTILVALAVIVCLLLAVVLGWPARSVTAKKLVAQPVHQESPGSDSNTFGFGRPATDEEIAAWDIDVQPDGTGLPAGSGTVAEGASLYAENCARCHSETGRESPFLLPFRALVGEYEAETWPEWPLTMSNYWPHATSVFDFVRRGMPYDTPGTLSDDEVYALVAWLLNQNGIIPDDAVMNAETILEVEMPALKHYRPYDPRDSYPFQ
jgi:cytochrome c